MKNSQTNIEMHESNDDAQVAIAQRQREQFDRNSAWLQEHLSDVYRNHRGKCICVAGSELFVGETAKDAIAVATAAHPDDKGWFTRYVPKEKVARVYAI